MNPEKAMADADDFCGRLFAERTKFTQPYAFNSKVWSIVTQFQLEVNNQYRFMFKDVPRKYKNLWVLKIIDTFVFNWLFNLLYEKIVGRKPSTDVIGIVSDAFKDFNNPDLEKGDAVWRTAENVFEQLPFTSILTGGRVPLMEGIPDVKGVVTGDADWKDELSKLLFLVPVGGVTQGRKTLQGAGVVATGGEYTKGGNLKYPIEGTDVENAQALLFGKSSLPENREYYNMNKVALTSSNTKEYEKRIKKGQDRMKTYRMLYLEQKEDTLQNKVDEIKKDKYMGKDDKREEMLKLQDRIKEIRSQK
jgi:hypothetical protein